jgi:asparagine synthase (glutamine-hydrolysing)
MCGIAALLDLTSSPNSVALLRSMHQPIRHRGPDGEGFLLVDPAGHAERFDHLDTLPTSADVRVGLAFRRLKIIDLSDAASQPMVSPDGQTWIVFNGEIYNFRELRRELEDRGRSFRSACDTEVVLAAYEAWGDQAFDRLDGMWALVIVDLRRRRLVGSRDRFGIKPLYWASDGSRLFLASEIKQLVGVSGPSPRPNAPVIKSYLRGTRYPCLDETFFEGIRSVPPASWFSIPLDGKGPATPGEFHCYWNLADHYCPEPQRDRPSYLEAVAILRSLLASAVQSHHVADVTVGSLLSGGLDSALLTSLLGDLMRTEGRSFPTFSFGFGDAAPEVCELRYVDVMVKRDRLVNHRTTFDADWVVKNVAHVIRTLEEPPLALPALAQYRVFELCRGHGATVVLDGEGSDEILGGYPYNQRTLLLDRLKKRRWGDFSRELRAIAARDSRSSAALLAGWFVAPLGRRLRRRTEWIAPEFGMRTDSLEERHARHDRGRDPSALNRELYFSLKWGNMKIILPYTDKNAMAHSVEARVPYFDRRFVEFAFSLPDHFKVGDGQRKRILRDVARERVPSEITGRQDRMGFGTPDFAMLRGPMWPSVRDVVGDPSFLSSVCLERPAAERFLDGFPAGKHRDFRAIWRLYALAIWTEVFGVRIS